MIPLWDDVNARARGLGTRLLTAPQVRALATLGDVQDVGERLARHGYGVAELGPLVTVEGLDRLVGRVAGARMALLARWLGPRTRWVRGVFEAADRDALRALVRGIAQGAMPATMLRGLTPTPMLPEQLLESLAQSPSLEVLGRRLARAGHPYHPVFRREANATAKNEVLRLELGLRRCFAERAREGARRGGKAVRRLATEVVDHENLTALLLEDAWGVEIGPDDLFIRGGRILFRERFMAIAAQPDAEDRRTSLRMAFRRTITGTMLADPGLNVAGLELGMRRGRLRAARQAMRTDPLGVWVLVWVALRIEAEAYNLRRILRGLSLGAPVGAMHDGLVQAS
ncbi:MAG: V-type ATPase subunit [Gemmatimonadales bacterium]